MIQLIDDHNLWCVQLNNYWFYKTSVKNLQIHSYYKNIWIRELPAYDLIINSQIKKAIQVTDNTNKVLFLIHKQHYCKRLDSYNFFFNLYNNNDSKSTFLQINLHNPIAALFVDFSYILIVNYKYLHLFSFNFFKIYQILKIYNRSHSYQYTLLKKKSVNSNKTQNLYSKTPFSYGSLLDLNNKFI